MLSTAQRIAMAYLYWVRKVPPVDIAVAYEISLDEVDDIVAPIMKAAAPLVDGAGITVVDGLTGEDKRWPQNAIFTPPHVNPVGKPEGSDEVA